jgi:hypothetical protein
LGEACKVALIFRFVTATIFGLMTTRRGELISLALLLALTLAMFGDVLFVGGTRVVGFQISDLFLQFLSWRDFGFRELAKGNLALWNPHIFSGAPYFGAMQAALLYPPNWLFLILPLPAAVNWTTALHVFTIGAFMFCWMRVRGLQVMASFLAGCLVMFCGAHFLHIFVGHLPHLLAMTWAPLIFCAIDALFETRNFRWCLVGMLAIAMQILAGFPQHVFYTAIVAGLYSALRLIGNWNWSLAGFLLAIYPGGAALSAVQLLAANQTMRETVRGIPLPFEFASALPFPPENFIILLVPNFFNDAARYWGRGYLWETALFVGVTGFLLALYAAIYCERRIKWIPLTVLCAALLLALGAHTPLFRFLYDFVPGFNKFRSVSKFIFSASLFLILLAATGLDRLLRQRKVEPKFILAAFLLAASLGIAGLWTTGTGSWRSLMDAVHALGESYLLPEFYASSGLATQSQHCAAISFALAAVTCGLFAGLSAVVKHDTRALHGIVLLGVAEMFLFARAARPTFDSASVINQDEISFLDQHPGDYRIINRFNPNSAMSIGASDLWGYDASVVRRYAEFVAWSQGGDPDSATQDVNFKWADPLYSMLRLRYVLLPQPGNFQAFEIETPPMPHVQLVSKYRIAKNRDAIFHDLRSPDFAPRTEVILETEPDPLPVPTETSGDVKIVAASTDSLTIEADVVQPAMLLITDVYTSSWRAVSLPGSVQSNYHLQPANYILRAVPLMAGHHRLRVEYASSAFAVGKWISLGASVLFFVAWWRFRQTKIPR